jgi:hypothetical protein
MHKLLSRALPVALVLGFTCHAGAEPGGDAKAVVEKSIAAQGGAKNLEKLKMTRMKGKGNLSVMGQELPFTVEMYQELPSRHRMVLKLNFMGTDIQNIVVFNGDKGWVKLQDDTKDADAAALDQLKAEMYAARVTTLIPLTGPGFTLTSLGETSINGKAALGVKVASAGQKDISLYFDKSSGLLVKLSRPGVDPIGKAAVTLDQYFSDYKDYEGVKQPTKTVVNHDNKKFMEAELTEFTFPASLDAKLFERP